MSLWLRFQLENHIAFGTLDGDTVTEWEGELFHAPVATTRRYPLAGLHLLAPCQPTKMIGLWNNFHERAVKENLTPPQHPLYFLKPANSFAGPGEAIPRPRGYDGQVVFEGELGIVIGHRIAHASASDATAAIFGYTCVNDVTARDLMRLDPAFVQWTRAKGFDRFGVFGPAIATSIDPAQLRVRVTLDGELKQDYPVSDMIIPPHEIVSRLSQDMTLEPGDVIACGTSVGACAMANGVTVEVSIEGIGRLRNVFGS